MGYSSPSTKETCNLIDDIYTYYYACLCVHECTHTHIQTICSDHSCHANLMSYYLTLLVLNSHEMHAFILQDIIYVLRA